MESNASLYSLVVVLGVYLLAEKASEREETEILKDGIEDSSSDDVESVGMLRIFDTGVGLTDEFLVEAAVVFLVVETEFEVVLRAEAVLSSLCVVFFGA